MNLEKLKDTARKFEQKEDWRKAIDVYLRAIQQIESGAEPSPDLSLYNRVGDLYLKINDTAAAVRSYERAVDLYADQGFFNNAIALCGKILRVNPGRTQTYLKLAQLHARKNVVIEAKRNLLEFLERMNTLGQLDQAFQSVKEFADQFSGSQEIRVMLVDLLRAASREDEAREQLEKLAGDLEARGDKVGARRTRERLHEIEHEEQTDQRAAGSAARRGDLVFLDTGLTPAAPAGTPPAAPPAGLIVAESVSPPAAEPAESILDPGDPGALAGGSAVDSGELLGLERTEELMPPPSAEPPAELEPLEIERDSGELELAEGLPIEGLDALVKGAQDFAPEPVEDLEPVELDLHGPDAEQASPAELPFIQVEEPGAPALAEFENRVLDDPENPDVHRELGEALLAAGQVQRSLDEFDLALAIYEAREEWGPAAAVTDRLLTCDPDSIRHHQKRVELAYRMGEKQPLIDAYLSLGEALERAGAVAKAVAVYRRVQEHDPGNGRARVALAALEADRPRAGVPPAVVPAGTSEPAPGPAPAGSVEAARPLERQVEPPPTPPSRQPAPAAQGAEFVDLGSMVFDEAAQRDTRMRIDRREPIGQDEQREFQEILEQFKRGIEENLEADDYQAHYDLGVAFKEMGLLDEAIAEFQKALRSPEGRLRTSEALGIAFYEKGQYAVSETVLRRAVDTTDGGDEAKIGLIYWLGRAAEAQGKDADALTSYERAMAVDIRFMDLGERVRRLTAGRRR